MRPFHAHDDPQQKTAPTLNVHLLGSSCSTWHAELLASCLMGNGAAGTFFADNFPAGDLAGGGGGDCPLCCACIVRKPVRPPADLAGAAYLPLPLLLPLRPPALCSSSSSSSSSSIVRTTVPGGIRTRRASASPRLVPLPLPCASKSTGADADEEEEDDDDEDEDEDEEDELETVFSPTMGSLRALTAEPAGTG